MGARIYSTVEHSKESQLLKQLILQAQSLYSAFPYTSLQNARIHSKQKAHPLQVFLFFIFLQFSEAGQNCNVSQGQSGLPLQRRGNRALPPLYYTTSTPYI